mgnify:CR=1 FL=1
MLFHSFNCLSLIKGPAILEDAVRLVAIEAACALYPKRLTFSRFQSSSCQGRIKTDWRGYQVGRVYGVTFRTDIEHRDGDFDFRFLLSQEDLEQGVEFFKPDPEGTYSRVTVHNNEVDEDLKKVLTLALSDTASSMVN